MAGGAGAEGCDDSGGVVADVDVERGVVVVEGSAVVEVVPHAARTRETNSARAPMRNPFSTTLVPASSQLRHSRVESARELSRVISGC